MRRTAIILTLVLSAALLSSSDVRGGGGANNPPLTPCAPDGSFSDISGCRTIVPGTATGALIVGSFFLDPHNPGVTSTASDIFEIKLSLKEGNTTVSKVKGTIIPQPGTALALGCVASSPFTLARFGYDPDKQTTLYDWINESAVVELFAPFALPGVPGGITAATRALNDPVITLVAGAECVKDPHNPGPLFNPDESPDGAEGLLRFLAVVRFRVPCDPGLAVTDTCSHSPEIP